MNTREEVSAEFCGLHGGEEFSGLDDAPFLRCFGHLRSIEDRRERIDNPGGFILEFRSTCRRPCLCLGLCLSFRRHHYVSFFLHLVFLFFFSFLLVPSFVFECDVVWCGVV